MCVGGKNACEGSAENEQRKGKGEAAKSSA